MFQKIKFWVEENAPRLVVFSIMTALSIGLVFALGGDVMAGAHRR